MMDESDLESVPPFPLSPSDQHHNRSFQFIMTSARSPPSLFGLQVPAGAIDWLDRWVMTPETREQLVEAAKGHPMLASFIALAGIFAVPPLVGLVFALMLLFGFTAFWLGVTCAFPLPNHPGTNINSSQCSCSLQPSLSRLFAPLELGLISLPSTQSAKRSLLFSRATLSAMITKTMFLLRLTRCRSKHPRLLIVRHQMLITNPPPATRIITLLKIRRYKPLPHPMKQRTSRQRMEL